MDGSIRDSYSECQVCKWHVMNGKWGEIVTKSNKAHEWIMMLRKDTITLFKGTHIRIREYSQLFLSVTVPIHGQCSKTPLICYPVRKIELIQTMKFTWQVYFDDLKERHQSVSCDIPLEYSSVGIFIWVTYKYTYIYIIFIILVLIQPGNKSSLRAWLDLLWLAYDIWCTCCCESEWHSVQAIS